MSSFSSFLEKVSLEISRDRKKPLFILTQMLSFEKWVASFHFFLVPVNPPLLLAPKEYWKRGWISSSPSSLETTTKSLLLSFASKMRPFWDYFRLLNLCTSEFWVTAGQLFSFLSYFLYDICQESRKFLSCSFGSKGSECGHKDTSSSKERAIRRDNCFLFFSFLYWVTINDLSGEPS